MAKNDTKTLVVELTMKSSHVNAIASSVPGEAPMPSKIAMAALGLMEDVAEGGIMLPHLPVQRMTEALGREPGVNDIVEKFSIGCGRRGSSLAITIYLDPVDEPVAIEAARCNGFQDPQSYMQTMWNDAWERGWFHPVSIQNPHGGNPVQLSPNDPMPAHVRMSAGDYAELKSFLGKDFSNGTELAALVKELASGGGIFAEARP